MGGMKNLVLNLNKYSSDLGLMYYTMLNIWILSFNPESYKYFLDSEVNTTPTIILTLL